MRQEDKQPQETPAELTDSAPPATTELGDLSAKPLTPEHLASIRGGAKTGNIDSGVKVAVDL